MVLVILEGKENWEGSFNFFNRIRREQLELILYKVMFIKNILYIKIYIS